MKSLIIPAAIVSAIAFAAPAQATGSYAGVGLYDFYNSDISLSAGTSLNDKVSVHGQYIDGLDFVLRATAEYRLEDGFYALGGVSRYNGAFDNKSGAILGAGYRTHLDRFPINITANYDTALDGFFSVAATAQYQVNNKLAVQAGYRVNSNDIDNEFGLGIRISF